MNDALYAEAFAFERGATVLGDLLALSSDRP